MSDKKNKKKKKPLGINWFDWKSMICIIPLLCIAVFPSLMIQWEYLKRWILLFFINLALIIRKEKKNICKWKNAQKISFVNFDQIFLLSTEKDVEDCHLCSGLHDKKCTTKKVQGSIELLRMGHIWVKFICPVANLHIFSLIDWQVKNSCKKNVKIFFPFLSKIL